MVSIHVFHYDPLIYPMFAQLMARNLVANIEINFERFSLI